MPKVNLSQVLKFKPDATGKVDLSRLGYVGGYDIKQELNSTNSRAERFSYPHLKIKMHSDGTRSIISSPSDDGNPIPEPCKGCAFWRGVECNPLCQAAANWLGLEASKHNF